MDINILRGALREFESVGVVSSSWGAGSLGPQRRRKLNRVKRRVKSN